ncbi:MAG: hypothetical protein HRF40_10080 [Nitrososphaera sp.]|jgi:hypothetical protein
MIDTKKMREMVQENYESAHWDGCEYEHYPCAVLALCDEVEKLRAEVERLIDLEQTYHIVNEEMDECITDGFGGWWEKTCRKCGADMVIVRPGDARCSVECYLRDEERKETEDESNNS